MIKKSTLGLFSLALVLGCAHLIVDPSIPAVDAGDYTLAMSACDSVPGHGMDICRVQEGTVINSTWRLVVPGEGRGIIGGEVTVYYRDVQKNYAVTGNLIEIPWREFFGQDTWTRDLDGEALAHVSIRYETPSGIEEIVRFRGIAKLVVTAAGYSRMPIDSGYAGWKTKCEVAYSTAGRGALRCK